MSKEDTAGARAVARRMAAQRAAATRRRQANAREHWERDFQSNPAIDQWAKGAPEDGPAEGETPEEHEARIASLRAHEAEQDKRFRCPACGMPGALANGGDRYHPSTCKPNESKGE